MIRRASIVALLLLQACLLFSALSLLPVWADESFTIKIAALPVHEIITAVQRDIHPPLYFLLLHLWRKLPLPWTGLAALRAFSAVWALLATLLLNLFWARRWPAFERWLALSLFAFSPCLLLYSRMARSYSMQVALAMLALGMLQRWIRQKDSLAAACGACLAALAVLYTHYLPGVAVLAGFVVVSWRIVGFGRGTWFLLAVAAGYLPWLITLTGAIERWGEAGSWASTYNLTGNPILEQAVKIGFGLVSLTIGESFLAVSLLLVPLLVALAFAGARSGEFGPSLRTTLGVAAVVGYLGVSRWVSYPFIPGRLVWLLPFLCLAVSAGIGHVRNRQVQGTVVTLLILSYISSQVLYFRRENFLNLGYVAPLPEIAGTLNAAAKPRDLILVDGYNTDFQALGTYLSGYTPMVVIDPRNADAARRAIRSAATVWIVRNTRDISPGGLTSRLQSEACSGRTEHDQLLEPYAAWQELVLGWMRFHPRPTHFYQLTRCGPASDTLKGDHR